MSEAERAEALKAIQLELFQIKRSYVQRRRELKRQFVLIQGMGQKRCRKCRELMDVEQFYLDNRYLDQRYPYCIECCAERYKLKRKGNVIAQGRVA
jgi:hypothetical protein